MSELPWITAVPFIIFVVVLVLRGLCRWTKVAPESLVGVQPLPMPFASRKEYLAAALEMDLEQFLERAHVTPAHIKYSYCSETKAAREKLAKIQERMERSDKLKRVYQMYQEPDIKQTVTLDAQGQNEISEMVNNIIEKFSSGLSETIELKKLKAQVAEAVRHASGPGPCPVGAQGVAGMPGISGVPPSGPGGAGFPGMYSNGVLTIDSFPMKLGCWYRTKDTGELVRLCDNSGQFLRKLGFCRYPWSEVELAIPRVGETWTYNQCQKHAPTKQLTPFVVYGGYGLGVGGSLVRDWVLCGCLVPFGFGEGKIQGLQDAAGIPGPGSEGYLNVVDGLPRKAGCWYRSKDSGRLIKLECVFGNHSDSFVDRLGVDKNVHVSYLWSEVELAIPRAGETWMWTPCSEHGVVSKGATFVVTPETPIQDSSSNKFVLCGCLVPFEFGMGKIQG